VEINDKPIIVLFDGVCNLCNGAVQFIIRHDITSRFRFASLQSEFAKQLLKRFGKNSKALDTIYVLDNNELYERSDAALRIAKYLDRVSWLYHARIIPGFIRDVFYNLIARFRYSFFGRRNECMIPTPELKDRFLS
jgi:predicted DCC family thiol-disulfide oxidoreductase YuxK